MINNTGRTRRLLAGVKRLLEGSVARTPDRAIRIGGAVLPILGAVLIALAQIFLSFRMFTIASWALFLIGLCIWISGPVGVIIKNEMREKETEAKLHATQSALEEERLQAKEETIKRLEEATRLLLAVDASFMNTLLAACEVMYSNESDRPAHLRDAINSAAYGVHLLLDHADGARCIIYQKDPKTSKYQPTVYAGKESMAHLNRKRPLNSPVAKLICRSEDGLWIRNMKVDRANSKHFEAGSQLYGRTIGSFIGERIALQGQPFGILTIEAPSPDAFRDSDWRIAKVMSIILGIAFAHAVDKRVSHATSA